MKKFLILPLLLLTACGSASPEIQNVADAMAESSCLIFTEEYTLDTLHELEAKTNAALQAHGFEKISDIDDYLETIRDTEKINELNGALRKSLQNNCGDSIKEAQTTPADLANSMLQ